MIFMPPRHGKSRTTTELFPAYYLGMHPDHAVILTSYGGELAKGQFGREVRQVMDHHRYPFEDVKPRENTIAAGTWNIEGRRGRFHAAGIGGGITGRGAHLLVIDDPIKTPAEAYSPTYRRNIWQWYTGTAYQRLENELFVDEEGKRRRAAVVLVMTRWHEDDLAGRLLKQAQENPKADQWYVLRMPARAEAGDPLGRPLGAPLWPQKYDDDDLVRIEASTDPLLWEAEYQQRPTRAGGSLFRNEWFGQRYDTRVLPVYDRIVQVCDANWKKVDDGSFAVVETWGMHARGYDVLDVWRERVDYPTLVGRLADNYFKWLPYGCEELYIEDAAAGRQAIETLMAMEDLRGVVNVVPFDVAGFQQYAFVQTTTPFFRALRVRLPVGAPWVEDYIREHLVYPAGENDDQVVCTAMALRVLVGGTASRRDEGDLRYFGRPGAPLALPSRDFDFSLDPDELEAEEAMWASFGKAGA